VTLAYSCRLFGITRQGVYLAKKRGLKRAKQLELVKELVLEQRRFMPRLGTRKLYYLLKKPLQKAGVKLGRDGLFAYLRCEHLLVRARKSYTKTTQSRHWLHKHPNLYDNKPLQRPEQVFVSDITYIKTKANTLYLSLVTDAYSRKIMGYHLSPDLHTQGVVRALEKALKQRKTRLPLIHHSDRGIQYCSSLYQNALAKQNIRASMTDGYDCYQNALAERINGILKGEFLFYTCKDERELKHLIDESILIYNNYRPHLSLNMETPNLVHEKATEAISCG
jgi:putative transposase